jgi:hypothetical protein
MIPNAKLKACADNIAHSSRFFQYYSDNESDHQQGPFAVCKAIKKGNTCVLPCTVPPPEYSRQISVQRGKKKATSFARIAAPICLRHWMTRWMRSSRPSGGSDCIA